MKQLSQTIYQIYFLLFVVITQRIMYQIKPTKYHQRKGKNTIVGLGSYYNIFRINSDVKSLYNMNTFAKKKQIKVKNKK